MPALPFIPAVIGAAGSIGSSLIGSHAAGNAAQAQVNAQTRAQDIAKGAVMEGRNLATGATGDANNVLMGTTGDANRTISDAIQQQLQMYQPYIQAGTDSVGTIQQLAGAGGPLDQKFSFNPTDLQSDPGYAFTLDQGQKALQRSAAAKGGLFSTGTLKSLAGYTTGTANQYFNDAFQRAASTFGVNRDTALSRVNTLQGLAGLGYGATGSAAGAVQSGAGRIGQNLLTTGQQMGSNIFRTGEYNSDLGMQGARIATGLEENKGNAQAGGIMQSANAQAGGILGATNAASKGIADWLAMRKTGNAAPNGPAGGAPIYGGG